MVDYTTHKSGKHTFKHITKEQSKDTGMAMVLIVLILMKVFPDNIKTLLAAAIVILVINMVVPIIYKPLAWLWFGFSHILGTFMSKILLSVVYLLVVTPMGLLRKLIGKDSLLLKKWKKGTGSVFMVRDQTYTAKDIEFPY